MAISWIKDKFIIQIVYTNVLNKDSTFEYFPASGGVGPVDPPVDPPTDPVDPPVDPPTDPVDPPVDPPTDPVDPPVSPPIDVVDPEDKQSSAGTIVASVVVLLTIFSLGTAGAVFVYKKNSRVVLVSEVICGVNESGLDAETIIQHSDISMPDSIV